MVKKKILIVGWLYLIYPIVTAKEYFELLNYEVYFFPLLKFRRLIKDKNVLKKSILSFIKNIDPNIILWWNWELEENILKEIKKNTNNILHCLFNWDHPFCLSKWDNLKNRKITSKNIWDICFVTADYKLNEYINSGSKEVYYLRMFSDHEVHFKEKDPKYECDISFVLTNLYKDKKKFSDQIFDRETFIRNIIREKDIKLRIYGSEHFKKIFPNNYHGFVHFLDNHKVFSNSKISISITEGVSGYKYCNERVGTVLSSGGLLFCDKINGINEILTDGHDCILIDKNNYISQIKNIIKNYDNYKHIKENAVKTAQEKFSPKFWSEFIHKKIIDYSKKYNTGKNLNQVYSFQNYKKDRISIVMTYYNRIDQLKHTLTTINESKYPKNLIEVICYDDGSEQEPLVLNTADYSFNLKLIYGNKDKNKKIINPTNSYNNAFKYITGEYIILQNSECMHIGDIISNAYQKLKKNKNILVSFPCWATANENLSKEVFNNRFNSNNLKKIIDNKWQLLEDYPKEFKGWYNEKNLRPECLHFCNSFHIETFKKVGLFDTKFEELLGYDDNDYAKRLMLFHGINILIPDHNYKLFTVHQYHGKYNKPRSYDLFLKSNRIYKEIFNEKKKKFLEKKMIKNNYIELDYKNINKNEFINNLSEKWTECFVFLRLTLETNLDIIFLRKCLKFSNFRILYN
jgi:hypothetical protein